LDASIGDTYEDQLTVGYKQVKYILEAVNSHQVSHITLRRGELRDFLSVLEAFERQFSELHSLIVEVYAGLYLPLHKFGEWNTICEVWKIRVLPVAKNCEPHLRVKLCVQLGVIYSNQRRLEAAWECFQSAYQIWESVSPSRALEVEVATLLFHMGVWNQRQDKPTEAQPFFEQCIVLANKIQARETEAFASSQLSQIYAAIGNFDQSHRYLDNCMEIWKSLGEEIGLARTTHYTRGKVYLIQGEVTKAVEHFSRAYEINKTLNDPEGLSHCAERLARCLFFLNHKSGEIIKYATDAINLASKDQTQDIACVLSARMTLLRFYARNRNVFSLYTQGIAFYSDYRKLDRSFWQSTVKNYILSRFRRR